MQPPGNPNDPVRDALHDAAVAACVDYFKHLFEESEEPLDYIRNSLAVDLRTHSWDAFCIYLRDK